MPPSRRVFPALSGDAAPDSGRALRTSVRGAPRTGPQPFSLAAVHGRWPDGVQVFEVTPAEKIVWKLQTWKDPNLGPS